MRTGCNSNHSLKFIFNKSKRLKAIPGRTFECDTTPGSGNYADFFRPRDRMALKTELTFPPPPLPFGAPPPGTGVHLAEDVPSPPWSIERLRSDFGCVFASSYPAGRWFLKLEGGLMLVSAFSWPRIVNIFCNVEWQRGSFGPWAALCNSYIRLNIFK